MIYLPKRARGFLIEKQKKITHRFERRGIKLSDGVNHYKRVEIFQRSIYVTVPILPVTVLPYTWYKIKRN